jgi:NAD(P)-dependent dehydrogenase (short-subunit alcohol dehydrogenase family)
MNKHIVITGPSSGIGFYLAKELSLNNKVMGLCRRKPKINEKNFSFIKTDLLKEKSIKQALKKIKKIDILINNAAITKTKKKNKFQNFKEILDTNLLAPFFLTELLKKKLSNSENPVVINMCSINSYQGFPNNPGYNSSKGGLLLLTKSMAIDLSKHNIRVNSISPGYFKTAMTKKSYKNKFQKKKRLSRMILNRWGEPKDLLGIVEFLISKKSSYITGQDFIIDGGWLSKGL